MPSKKFRETEQPDRPVLVFTDLDGTLLDHHTYEYGEARNLLAFLGAEKIPVIPVSSKTRAELDQLCRQIGLAWGYIAENGAVACLPADVLPPVSEPNNKSPGLSCKEFINTADHWQSLVQEAGQGFQYAAFSQCSSRHVAEMTGLDEASAELARKREYGEVVEWRDSLENLDEFVSELVRGGACVSRGGRFIHVGGDVDKGTAMNWVVSVFAQHTGKKPLAIAAGDGLNDIPMLKLADISVIVRSPVNAPPTWDYPDHQKVIMTERCGPAGWETGMILALEGLGVSVHF